MCGVMMCVMVGKAIIPLHSVEIGSEPIVIFITGDEVVVLKIIKLYSVFLPNKRYFFYENIALKLLR